MGIYDIYKIYISLHALVVGGLTEQALLWIAFPRS